VIAVAERLGDRYEAVKELTRQDHCRGLRARDVLLGQSVLAVALEPSAAVLGAQRDRLAEAFRKELRAVSHCADARIAAPIELRLEGTEPFAIFEDPARPSLAERLQRSVSWEHAITLARDLCDVLSLLQQQGLQFTAVPLPFLFRTDEDRLRWVHLGIGNLTDSPTSLAAAGRTVSAPHASPEELRGGPVSGRSLVFSVAAVLYELLCGARAFPGETVPEILAAMDRGEPEPLWLKDSMIPGDLADLVQRSLQADPDRRPADLQAFAQELAAAAESLTPGVPAEEHAAAVPLPPAAPLAEPQPEPEEAPEPVETAAAVEVPETAQAAGQQPQEPVEPTLAVPAEPVEAPAEAVEAAPEPAEEKATAEPGKSYLKAILIGGAAAVWLALTIGALALTWSKFAGQPEPAVPSAAAVPIQPAAPVEQPPAVAPRAEARPPAPPTAAPELPAPRVPPSAAAPAAPSRPPTATVPRVRVRRLRRARPHAAPPRYVRLPGMTRAVDIRHSPVASPVPGGSYGRSSGYAFRNPSFHPNSKAARIRRAGW